MEEVHTILDMRLPSENILLFIGQINLRQGDKTYSFRNTKIEAMWPPTQYCVIKLPEVQEAIAEGSGFLDIPNNKISGIPVQIFRAINEEGYRIIFKAKQNFLINGSRDCDLIVARIPNFFNISLHLKTPEWDIKIVPVPNIDDLIRVMSLQSGFSLTHIVYIKKIENTQFSYDQAEIIIRALETFLSFLRGAWCSLFLPVGWKEGNISWQQWYLPMVMPWRTTPINWCDTFNVSELSEAFNKFINLSEYPELINVISFYSGANGYEAPDISVVMTQVSLELLVTLYANEGTYREHKDIKIRRLLEKKRISAEIPEELKGLKKYCELNIKDGSIIDGPTAIVHLRNLFMHPKIDTIGKILKVPTNIMNEATSLGLAYVELILLESLEYRGNYTDRFTRRSQPTQWSISKDIIQPVVNRPSM